MDIKPSTPLPPPAGDIRSTNVVINENYRFTLEGTSRNDNVSIHFLIKDDIEAARRRRGGVLYIR
jgi:hypothetical protein